MNNSFPDKKDWPHGEPTLAVNFDDVNVDYPMLGQPKLNGIRACWDGTHLISRQRKVWKDTILPHIYEHLRGFSSRYPGTILDGELYCHGLAFQDVAMLAAVNRINPDPAVGKLSFHAFDIISSDHTESRQITLANIYKPWVAVCRIASPKEADLWTNRFVEAGFEGLMMRSYGCPYLHGRTEGLIKVKPWKYAPAVITGFTAGKGKYTGILGALEVRLESGKTVKVSGGLSDTQRLTIWQKQPLYALLGIKIKYRELSRAGIPLQPQIVSI